MTISLTTGFPEGDRDSTTGATHTWTPTTSFNAGRTAVIFVHWDTDTVTIDSVTLGGDSCTPVAARVDFTSIGTSARCYRLENIGSSGTKQIVVTYSASVDANGKGIAVWEIDGSVAIPSFDAENNGQATGSNGSITLTTGEANAAIFALMSSKADATQGTGYTLFDILNVVFFSTCEYDLDVGAAGSKTVDFVHTSSDWGILAVSFKEVAGGISIPVLSNAYFMRRTDF